MESAGISLAISPSNLSILCWNSDNCSLLAALSLKSLISARNSDNWLNISAISSFIRSRSSNKKSSRGSPVGIYGIFHGIRNYQRNAAGG